MKIFVDARSLYAHIISGVPEYTRLAITAMARRFPSEEFLFFANRSKMKSKKNPLENEVKGEWLNLGISNKIWSATNRLFGLPKIDKLVRADVYWSPHIDILSFKNPARHVLTIHDLSFVFYPEFFTWQKNFWHWRQNYERQIKEAGRVIAVSEFTRRTIIDRFRLDERKVVRIYPGLDDFYRDKTEGKETDERKYPFLLHVGTLEPRKNAIGAIRAFNLVKQNGRFKDLKFILVGAPGWLYQKILAEIDRSPAKNDIVVWGKATREDLRSLYRQAAAFVYPSFFEGFAFPCLEAQASGTPVIASNRGPLEEVLGTSALLVDPWKIGDLALAIESVLLDNKVKEHLIEAGRKNADRFQWQTTAEELMKTFREIHG